MKAAANKTAYCPTQAIRLNLISICHLESLRIPCRGPICRRPRASSSERGIRVRALLESLSSAVRYCYLGSNEVEMRFCLEVGNETCRKLSALCRALCSTGADLVACGSQSSRARPVHLYNIRVFVCVRAHFVMMRTKRVGIWMRESAISVLG